MKMGRECFSVLPASRRATVTVVCQTQVTYTYDNANRLTQVQQGTSTVTIGL